MAHDYTRTRKGIRAVGALLMLLSVGNAYSLDLAQGWKSGEMWKAKRQPMWEDVPLESVNETSTRPTQKNLITFGRHQVEGNVVIDWKEGKEAAPEATEQKPSAQEGKKQTPPAKDKSGDDGNKKASQEAEWAKKFNTLCRVTCDIYNRNDFGDIDKESFDNRLSSFKTELSRVSGAKMTKVRIPASKSSTKVEAFQWEGAHGVARLYVATTTLKKEKKKEKDDKKEEKKQKDGGVRAEYIRMVLAPDVASIERASGSASKGDKRAARAAVKEKDGSVWIKDFPMVEQGMKAPSFPAQMTRMLKYYGVEGADVDTVSALCESPSDGYTREWMDSTLKQIAHNYRFKVKELTAPWMERAAYMKEYTSRARKEKKIEEDIDITEEVYLEPALWLELFAKKKSDCNKWLGSIRSCIDSGIPVIWFVFRGDFYPVVRDPRGTSGPHVRLIIGYDATKGKEKIIYTEAWSNKGERCVIDLTPAYAATDSTYMMRQ